MQHSLLDPLPDALSVLIVEDDPATRLLMETLLPDTCAVDAAQTARTAEAALTGQSYDVALIDIDLGGETSGADLYRKMDEAGYWDSAAALAVTAYAMPGEREDILEVGFDGYVAKPFTKAQLLGAIAEALT